MSGKLASTIGTHLTSNGIEHSAVYLGSSGYFVYQGLGTAYSLPKASIIDDIQVFRLLPIGRRILVERRLTMFSPATIFKHTPIYRICSQNALIRVKYVFCVPFYEVYPG